MSTALLNRLGRRFRLSRDDIAALETFTDGRVVRTGAHQDIVREGETAGEPLLILSGWGACYKSLGDGRRQITAILLPGDFANLSRAGARMDHSIAALGPLSYAEVPRTMLAKAAHGRPRIQAALHWLSLVESANQREWSLNVGQRSALERVSHLLCELYLRMSSAGRAFRNACDFPITQTDIGNATGLTSVYVSRTLKQLRRLGLASTADGQLAIHDMDGLERISLFDAAYLYLEDDGRASEPAQVSQPIDEIGKRRTA